MNFKKFMTSSSVRGMAVPGMQVPALPPLHFLKLLYECVASRLAASNKLNKFKQLNRKGDRYPLATQTARWLFWPPVTASATTPGSAERHPATSFSPRLPLCEQYRALGSPIAASFLAQGPHNE